jgi:hypothetical protein
VGREPLSGHRAYSVFVDFDNPISSPKIRATFTHAPNGRTGLTEIEVLATRSDNKPIAPAPPPKGNLAFNSTGKGFPKASASYTSRFDKVAMANDGVVSHFQSEPAQSLDQLRVAKRLGLARD